MTDSGEAAVMTILVRAEIYVAPSRLDEFRKVATQTYGNNRSRSRNSPVSLV